MNWILKRNDTNEQLQLHSQYVWSDEFDWTPLAQSTPVYTLTGAMVFQQGTKKAGRPITLDCTHARIKRKDVKALQAWSSVAELELTLTHPDATEYTVIFSRPAITDIVEIINYKPADKSDDDLMRANINLITI